MPTRRSYVFDANAIVSAALIQGSVTRKAFDKAHRKGVVLLSGSVITELEDVLGREKLKKYLTEEERLLFMVALVREAKLVTVNETIRECRDPKDNKYLDLAVSGDAACIVSGDKDLLVMSPFRGIPIVTPSRFLADDSL